MNNQSTGAQSAQNQTYTTDRRAVNSQMRAVPETQATSPDGNYYRLDDDALLNMAAAFDRIEGTLAFLADYVDDPDAGTTTPKHATALINSAESELERLRAVVNGKNKNPD